MRLACAAAFAATALLSLAAATSPPMPPSPIQEVVARLAANPVARGAGVARSSESAPRGELKSTMLEMRDGVKLFTVFWTLGDQRMPTVVCRSPYGEEGTENLADLYLPFGFASVMQNQVRDQGGVGPSIGVAWRGPAEYPFASRDLLSARGRELAHADCRPSRTTAMQRGTGKSEGNFTFWSTAAEDEQDTVAWIKKQPWSDGRVYQMGASADGINTYLAERAQQQELAQWLIFATAEGYDTMWQNGALRQNLVKHWLDSIHRDRPNAPSYYDFVLVSMALINRRDPFHRCSLDLLPLPCRAETLPCSRFCCAVSAPLEAPSIGPATLQAEHHSGGGCYKPPRLWD